MVAKIRTEFWLVMMVVIFNYATFTPFFANVTMLLRSKFEFNVVEAGEIMVSSLKSIIFGYRQQ